MKSLLAKFISRKLFAVVVGTAGAFFYPPLLPLIAKIVPIYVAVQGTIDTVAAYKAK